MINIIKSVIMAGGYKLHEVQRKIKKLYAMGDITEAEMDELLSLAADGVSTDAERPEVLEMVKALSAKINELTERVSALEGGGEQPGAEDEIPDWKPWDYISDDYQYGSTVRHKGDVYDSFYEGQNVWEPGTQGTEKLWVKREKGDSV